MITGEGEAQTELCDGDSRCVNSTFFPLFFFFFVGFTEEGVNCRGEEEQIKEGEEKTGWQRFYNKRLAVSWIFPITEKSNK